MISQLRGKIVDKQPPHLLLDVNGVGYQISCPMSTFYAFDNKSDEITIHTHLVVREDAWQLYGFATRDERRLFRILIKINGVGPKLALTILSSMELSEFISTITLGDFTRLVAIPGIGKKTAERISVEARDAIHKWQQSGQGQLLSDNNKQPASEHSVLQNKLFEVQRALSALGYKDQESQRALKLLSSDINDSEKKPSVEILIRRALQLLSQPA
jgi:holliday junction DNA helicase RuvA